MVGTGIQVIGIPKSMAFLAGVNKVILAKANNGVKQAGFFMEGEIKESIAGQKAEPKSVDTGRFLNSVHAVFPKKLVAKVETNLSYARGLEFGTSRMQARHHFRNSVARNREKVTDFIKAEVKTI